MSGFISKNPFTRKLIQEIPYASKDAANKTIEALDAAYKARRGASGIDRSYLKNDLSKLASNIASRKDSIAKVIVAETGKPISGALGEVQKAIGHIQFFADNLSDLTSTKYIATDQSAKTGYYIDPLGVIFKVVPFNFPFWTPIKMMIPTLAAGNAVLVRPANSAPLTGLALQEVFRQSGFDNVDIVFSDPKDTEAILSHRAIQGLSFTGSTNVGKQIAGLAAKHIKRTVLELGGNDPFIVLEDADLDNAVANAIKTRLNNNGQVCNAGKRFIIHKKLFAAFAEKLEAKIKAMKIGDPLDPKTEISVLARDDLTDTLWQQVSRAHQDKASNQFLFGATQRPADNFFPVTAFKVNDTDKSLLMHEELFGPVFTLVEFESEDHAIQLANNTSYGLGAALMTKNLDKAESLIRRLEAGAVFVNSPVGSHSKLPSGGIKESGYGRDCGQHGVESFANIKAFSIKKP